MSASWTGNRYSLLFISNVTVLGQYNFPVPGRIPFNFNFANGAVGVGRNPFLRTEMAAPESKRHEAFFPSSLAGNFKNSLTWSRFDGRWEFRFATPGTCSSVAWFSFPDLLEVQRTCAQLNYWSCLALCLDEVSACELFALFDYFGLYSEVET